MSYQCIDVDLPMMIGRAHRECLFKAIPPGGRYLEWGAGGTTVWLARHLARGTRLVSIEHDTNWAAKVAPHLYNVVGASIKVPSCRPRESGPWAWSEEDPEGREQYIQSPLRHAQTVQYDVILIDGLCRIACAAFVKRTKLLAKGGAVFLHDSEKKWFDPIKEMFTTIGELPACEPNGPKMWLGKL